MKTLDQLFANPRLQGIIHKAKALEKIDGVVQALLDTELASHISVVNLDNNRLKLAADNAIWATRMRYQTATLLTALNQELGTKLQKIECVVRF